MSDRRLIDSYCNTCEDVAKHVIRPADPGSCVCTVCQTGQQLMVPID